MRSIFIVIIISFLLAGCATQPTVPTISVTASIPPTFTLAPTAQPTVEATATPEIKQFTVCMPERYMDCYVDSNDLLKTGKYLKWLNSLSVEFPKNMRTDVQMFHYDDGQVVFMKQTAPNFTGVHEGEEPEVRDVTAAYTIYNGKKYAIRPTAYFNKNNPSQVGWVINIKPLFSGDTAFSEENIQEGVAFWETQMNTTPIWLGTKPFLSDSPDEFMKAVYAEHPEIPELSDDFADFGSGKKGGGNRNAFNKTGVLLFTFDATDSGHSFE